jgi:serine/threonine-protein kinase
MTIEAGTKLGRYEVRSKIGEGGMGAVYLAQDTKLDRKVALKILVPNSSESRSTKRSKPQRRKSGCNWNGCTSREIIATIWQLSGAHGKAFEKLKALKLKAW